MIDVCKKVCYGCAACADICSREAITMREDSLGFLHPYVERGKCVECGRCSGVCIIGKEPEMRPPLAVHALRLRNKKSMAASQSGGAFVALSDAVLEKEGVVYGAGFGEAFHVRHFRAENRTARDSFRGSKYVQSDMRRIYREIARDLTDGRLVLFSGTPCQCAAVLRYSAGITTGKLITVDLICHGVASPKIFRDYLKYLEKKHRGRITGVKFRDKEFGWQSHRESFTFHNGKKVSPEVVVYKDYFLRESCNTCRFCSINRVSDITIGDFWGIEKTASEFASDGKGCSIVMCNTAKGMEILQISVKDCDILDIDSDADYLQMNLTRPTPPARDLMFAQIYRVAGFRNAMFLFGRIGKTVGLRKKIGALKKKIKGGKNL